MINIQFLFLLFCLLSCGKHNISSIKKPLDKFTESKTIITTDEIEGILGEEESEDSIESNNADFVENTSIVLSKNCITKEILDLLTDYQLRTSVRPIHLTKAAVEFIKDDILDTIVSNDLNDPANLFCCTSKKKYKKLTVIISLLSMSSSLCGLFIKGLGLHAYYTCPYNENIRYNTWINCHTTCGQNIDHNKLNSCKERRPLLKELSPYIFFFAIIFFVFLLYYIHNTIDPFNRKFKKLKNKISKFCGRGNIAEPIIELHINKNKKSKKIVKYSI